MLETTEKALRTMQEVMEATKDIVSKIGKVTNATDKIASIT